MKDQLNIFQEADYIIGIPKAERRFIASGKMEIRSSNGEQFFRGYAAKFDNWSNDLGGFREKIDRGFFNEVLKSNPDVRALFNHDPNYVLGRTTSDTLTIGSDDIGLWMEYKDPQTTWSRDLAISIKRGDINQMSFAFSLPEDGGDSWEKKSNGYERTLLNAAALYDVSVVTYPAYENTNVASRAMKRVEEKETEDNQEKKRADMEKALAEIRQDQFEMDAEIIKHQLKTFN